MYGIEPFRGMYRKREGASRFFCYICIFGKLLFIIFNEVWLERQMYAAKFQ